MSPIVTVPAGTTLTDAFPTDLADPETIVYDLVHAATQAGGTLQMFADGRPAPTIPVVAGWPPYPGQVPAIGVAAGSESEDKQADLEQGGFVGDVVAYDPAGVLVGSASYYSEPLYAPIAVTLIHENRDERDRLHNQLRMLLFAQRRELPLANARINQVTVDAVKQEEETGPPEGDQPFVVYISMFTVHVFHEMLVARDVAGPAGVVSETDVTVTTVDG